MKDAPTQDKTAARAVLCAFRLIPYPLCENVRFLELRRRCFTSAVAHIERERTGLWNGGIEGMPANTESGAIWATGDSKLIPQLLPMPRMDAILFDYSEDDRFHLGLEGSVQVLNSYPNTPVLLGRRGAVDAPDSTPFNGDPRHLIALVVNPQRIQVLAPASSSFWNA